MGDTLGKYIYRFIPSKDNWTFYTICVIRYAVLTIMYGQCVKFRDNAFFGSTAIAIILLFLNGLMSGYFVTACFVLGADRVEHYKSNTGYI